MNSAFGEDVVPQSKEAKAGIVYKLWSDMQNFRLQKEGMGFLNS